MNDTSFTLKALLFFNGYSYIDKNLEDSISLILKSYKNTPENLGDSVTDYFYEKLVYTSTTSHNSEPSTSLKTENKISICKGILSNVSLLQKLQFIKLPIVYVYSKKNSFVNLKHLDAIYEVCYCN